VSGGGGGTPNLTLAASPGLTIPTGAHTSGPISVSASVANTGTGSAGAFNCRFYLSTTNTFSTSNTVLGDVPVTGVNAGATTTATFTGTLPGSIGVGAYYVSVFIDNTNQVTETNETDNQFVSAGKVTVTVNLPPVVSSPANYSPTPALVAQQTTFTVAASDADGDPLTYMWNFGDGSGTGTGASANYTYSAPGTFTATVTISDGFGATVSSSVSVTVKYAVNQGNETKQSFMLNFKTMKDSIGVTMQNAAFAKGADGTKVQFVIGNNVQGTVVDTGTLLHNRAKGAIGTFTLNTRSATLQYTTTKASLQTLLAPYGATNTTAVGTSVAIPIYFLFNNAYYGNTFHFTYTAKAGKTGKGK
jgi:hypothetical protein